MLALLYNIFFPTSDYIDVEKILRKIISKSIPLLSTDEIISFCNISEVKTFLISVNKKITSKYGELPVSLFFLGKDEQIYLGIYNSLGEEIAFKNIKSFCKK